MGGRGEGGVEKPTPTHEIKQSLLYSFVLLFFYFCSMFEQERGLDQSNILAADLEECRSRLADRDHQFKELLHR
jgi:hypothetical protein